MTNKNEITLGSIIKLFTDAKESLITLVDTTVEHPKEREIERVTVEKLQYTDNGKVTDLQNRKVVGLKLSADFYQKVNYDNGKYETMSHTNRYIKTNGSLIVYLGEVSESAPSNPVLLFDLPNPHITVKEFCSLFLPKQKTFVINSTGEKIKSENMIMINGNPIDVYADYAHTIAENVTTKETSPIVAFEIASLEVASPCVDTNITEGRIGGIQCVTNNEGGIFGWVLETALQIDTIHTNN